MTLEEQVVEKITQVLQLAPGVLGLETKSDEIEAWDSMGAMEILFLLQSEFGIELAPNQMEQLNSIPSILALIRKHRELS